MNIQRLRTDTPGCESAAYFNNAGASLLTCATISSVQTYFEKESTLGGYDVAEDEKAAHAEFYTRTARLLHAKPEEISFQSCATRAWQMGLYSIPFKAGDTILLSTTEYISNYLSFLQLQEHYGIHIERIPDDENGQCSVEALKARLEDERVSLVAVTHMPTNDGVIQPVAEIGGLCRQAGVLFLVDACQSVGHVAIDVEKMGCDMLATTGRKYLRGPRGTGFLYVRQALLSKLTPPFVDLRSGYLTGKHSFEFFRDHRAFEAWECHFAGRIGLSEAIGYALELGVENIEGRVLLLGEMLRQKLSTLRGVHLNDTGLRKSGIVTFTIGGDHELALKAFLKEQGIIISVSPQDHSPLISATPGASVYRASVHYYNTEEEIDRLCNAVDDYARKVSRETSH